MKRIPRKMPKEHKEIDIMKPLIYEQLGSANDPCFGNYSAKDSACKRCGDSEICAAISGNKLLLQSYKVEEDQPFKDLDEGNLVDKQNLEIGKMMVKWVKDGDHDKWFRIERLIPVLTEKFNLTPKDMPVLIQRCIKAGKETKKIKFNKLKTKFKAKI